MKTDEKLDDTVAWNVIAIAQKHRIHMLHLLSAYGSNCVAFGQAVGSSSDSSREYRQMLECNRHIEEELSNLVMHARRYFSGRISIENEQNALGPDWSPLPEV